MSSASTDLRAAHQPTRLPGAYRWWLFGFIWTVAGNAVLTFGLAWVAAGTSGTAAGLVLSAGLLPRLLLSLWGGSVADRFGAWAVMVTADGLMAVVCAALTVVVLLVGTPLWVLMTAAGLMGVADAFYRPASGAFPRYLVPPGQMRQAAAARQIVLQLIGVAGPVLGGAVVMVLSLQGGTAAAAAGFAVMFLILLTLRTRRLPVARASSGRNLSVAVRDGLAYALRTPAVRVILVLLAFIAGFVIPLTGLLLPLLARDQGWPGAAAGSMAGAYGAGVLLSSVLFLLRPHSRLTRMPALAGTAVTGLAMLAVAVVPTPGWAGAACVAAGCGTGYFVAKAAPVLLTEVPDEYLSRIQSISLFVQTLPVLFANNLLGWLSDTSGAGTAVLVSGGALVAVTLTCGTSAAARRL
ncbi:MFS transporter [Arthrobacter sp. zg-Y40]|uniref:MFS transporter n=1 Tax=Arthrobacter sp. zg-Y40 TaxID=2886939 RepID=UPI001D143906|nr:MFS transporter [Arthrobacter sp. zg-Y40]MCC3278474.1 MFS transporter [Arthrobacter sp. zg-Y40]